MLRPLLLLSICAATTAAAATPTVRAAAGAAKFDKKVDKSLLQNDRLWPDGFLKFVSQYYIYAKARSNVACISLEI